MFRVVENVRRQQLQWLDFILRAKKWRIAELARQTGISASTFAKFRNDPENIARLQDSTVRIIEEATGIPYGRGDDAPAPRGLAERESSPYEAERLEVVNGAVQAMRSGKNGLDPWVLHSRCLETAGYLPGDILMVDLNGRPNSGDVVCAQIYDRGGYTETVFRIYEHPFLVAATYDAALLKPMLVDNERVVIRGVVVASFRERRAAA